MNLIESAQSPSWPSTCNLLTLGNAHGAATEDPRGGLGAAGMATPLAVGSSPRGRPQGDPLPGDRDIAPAGIAAALAAAIAAAAATAAGSRRGRPGRSTEPYEDREGLQEGGRPTRQVHAQEASHPREARLQDWHQDQGYRQAWPARPPNRDCSRHDHHHGQGGKQGKGKGPSQGRGKGRRGQGSKGKPAHEKRRTSPTTKEQHWNIARRKQRTAKRLGEATSAINDELHGKKSQGKLQGAKGNSAAPQHKEGARSGAATWFRD